MVRGANPGPGDWKSLKEFGVKASPMLIELHNLPRLELIEQTAKGAEPEGAEPLSSSSESSSSGSSSTSDDSSSSTTSVKSSESEAESADQERLWKVARRLGFIRGSC